MDDKNLAEEIDRIQKQKADQFFADIVAGREKIEESKKVIFNMMDLAVKDNRRDIFESLISYITKKNGQYALHYVGEATRILNLCQIISMEYEFGERLLHDGCDGYESLKEKYFLTIYALRRILFALSEVSVEEAKSYLQSTAPSYLAVHLILEREIFRVDEVFMERIIDIFRSIWTLAQLEAFEKLRGMGDE